MDIEVNISNITGQTPFDVYLCDANGNGCIYIKRFTSTPDNFIVPVPYSLLGTYTLKIIDADNCIITGKTTI